MLHIYIFFLVCFVLVYTTFKIIIIIKTCTASSAVAVNELKWKQMKSFETVHSADVCNSFILSVVNTSYFNVCYLNYMFAGPSIIIVLAHTCC